MLLIRPARRARALRGSAVSSSILITRHDVFDDHTTTSLRTLCYNLLQSPACRVKIKMLLVSTAVGEVTLSCALLRRWFIFLA